MSRGRVSALISRGFVSGTDDLNGIPRLHPSLLIGAALAIKGNVFPINQLLNATAGEVW
jgi:hypothetical protein